MDDVVRIDAEGTVVEGEGNLNPTIVFHLELHKARPDIVCAIHNHPPYGNIWACAGELPPLHDQTGAIGGGRAGLYAEYGGVVDSRTTAAELAAAFGDVDMAILVGHGTLVTASSVSLALLRAQCFEHRARKAWEVRAMGMTGVPLAEHHAERVAASAQAYADKLLLVYARELRRVAPDALCSGLQRPSMSTHPS